MIRRLMCVRPVEIVRPGGRTLLKHGMTSSGSFAIFTPGGNRT